MKKKINGKKIICLIFLTILLLARPVFADVGSFESYDSGSDWGGGSWDSDWGSSSSWDWDDDDYDYGYYGGGFIDGFGSFLWFIIVAAIVIASIVGKNSRRNPPRVNPYERRDNPGMYETSVLAKVKAIDPDFNKENFIAWSKTLFVKLQEAWTACDWETIRTFETKELFEQQPYHQCHGPYLRELCLPI